VKKSRPFQSGLINLGHYIMGAWLNHNQQYIVSSSLGCISISFFQLIFNLNLFPIKYRYDWEHLTIRANLWCMLWWLCHIDSIKSCCYVYATRARQSSTIVSIEFKYVYILVWKSEYNTNCTQNTTGIKNFVRFSLDNMSSMLSINCWKSVLMCSNII
jgi:hypothetical protein